jgi:hypothetical protein
MKRSATYMIAAAFIVQALAGAAFGQVNVTLGRPRAAQTVTELANGQAVANLQGSSEAPLLFSITVPRGATSLSVTTGGGRGDMDLYVCRGSAPTPYHYDQRSVESDNTERIDIARPPEGKYFILLTAFRPYFGVTLRVTYAGVPVRPPAHGAVVRRDRYESDDASERAKRFAGRAQSRTIHQPDDVDWLEYTPPSAGIYGANITSDLPLKILVYPVQQAPEGAEVQPIATFGTAEGKAAVPLLAVSGSKSFMLRISATSRRRRTGSYSIDFKQIVQFGRGHFGRPVLGTVPPATTPPATTPPDRGRLADHDMRAASLARPIKSGEKMRNLEGERGDKHYFRIYVPQGTRILRVITNDGEGNPDLYMSHNTLPTLRSEFSSTGRTTGEGIAIQNPRAGWYYIMVYGRGDFEDVDLLAMFH